MSERDEDLAATLALRRSLVSDDRQRHNRVLVERLADGFGHRARVQPILERMESRGQISARQARAGERIYQCYALGVAGAHNGEAGGSYDPGGYRDAQLAAAQEYRIIRDAVGGRLWPLAFSCCVEDWSVARWCNERGRGMDPRGAIALLRLALDVAADAIGDA